MTLVFTLLERDSWICKAFLFYLQDEEVAGMHSGKARTLAVNDQRGGTPDGGGFQGSAQWQSSGLRGATRARYERTGLNSFET